VRSVGRLVQVSSLLALLAALAACNGKGIQDAPEDINVSPRSQEAYDPVYQELENDPDDDEEEQP